MTTVDLSLLSNISFHQLYLRFDEERLALHVIFRPATRPCFNLDLLQELSLLFDHLSITQGGFVFHGRVFRLNFLVLNSGVDGVFSLGADHARVRVAIKKRDRFWLDSYARLCTSLLWFLFSPSMHLTTISLVQGSALGYGFEVALATDVLIAEEHSRFGFPESLFDLFPGMGAISFLSRRVGLNAAKDVVAKGEIFNAVDMQMLGVVDVLAERGDGLSAVDRWMDVQRANLKSYQAIARAKKIVSKLDRKELDDVAAVWVNSAMTMDENSVRNLETLIRAQINKPKLKAVK